MDGVMFAISIFLAIAGPTLLALALYRDATLSGGSSSRVASTTVLGL
jgi:hypothetical protein